MEIHIEDAKAGDILYAKNNLNKYGINSHFIIFLSSESTFSDQFIGAMLTTSPRYKNFALQENHFEKYDKNKNAWPVYYRSSFISSNLYHKKNNWMPFIKVGQLASEGLQFVLNKIGTKAPIYFPFNKKRHK